MESFSGDNKIPLQKNKILAAAVIAGFLLRLGWAVSTSDRHQPDEQGYHVLASGLVSHNIYGFPSEDGTVKPTSFYPPAWPFLLSIAYRAAGAGVKTGRILTALLGTAVIVLVFLIAADLFSQAAGLWAAWLAALHPILAYWSGLMMTETPFAFLCALGLWLELKEKPRIASSVFSGLVWGTAVLVRSTAVPIAAFLGALRVIKPGFMKNTPANAAFLLGLAVLPLLWGQRNHGLFNTRGLDFHGGYNLMLGTLFFTENQTDSDLALAALRRQPWYPEATALDEPRRDKYFLKKSLEFMKENPGKYLTIIVPNNLKQFWRLYPRQDHSMPHGKSLLFWVSILAEAPLFILCGIGLWVRRSMWRKALPLLAYPLILTAIHAASVSQMRYRMPVTPVMIVFAGAAAAWLAGKTGRGTLEPG